MIRPFSPQDADAVAALWYASSRSMGIQVPEQTTAADLRQRIDRELSAGWTVFVAERDGVVLGFTALIPSRRRLDQLFVAPGVKRSGIGRQLFELAKAVMPDGFWLRTAADNREARAFYDVMGMTLDRIEPHPRRRHDSAIYTIGNFDVG